VGIHTRPVLLGPVSFLLLGKAKDVSVQAIVDEDINRAERGIANSGCRLVVLPWLLTDKATPCPGFRVDPAV
jgi:hypothetical protein